MRTIGKLFGRAPFRPLQSHMVEVAGCVELLAQALAALSQGQAEKLEPLAAQISEREHNADRVKNDIRNHLPKSLFLPVDRNELLEMLSIQDSIADKAENVGVLLTLKPLVVPPWLQADLLQFSAKNMEAVEAVQRIIDELDELLEYSFGGAEAEKVKRMVDHVALLEHEADVIQRGLLKLVLSHDQELSPGDLILWLRIFRELAALANLAEKLAHRVRSTLERK